MPGGYATGRLYLEKQRDSTLVLFRKQAVISAHYWMAPGATTPDRASVMAHRIEHEERLTRKRGDRWVLNSLEGTSESVEGQRPLIVRRRTI
jgi:hypothetical protein